MLSLLVVGSYYLRQAYGCILTCKNKGEKNKKIVQTIKESGFYSPEKGYEGLSLTQGLFRY